MGGAKEGGVKEWEGPRREGSESGRGQGRRNQRVGGTKEGGVKEWEGPRREGGDQGGRSHRGRGPGEGLTCQIMSADR